MSNPVRKVLVVDDSSVVRRSIVSIFQQSGLLQVVGEAENGQEALAMIPRLTPDLVTLDVVMPVLSGLTTLKYIMIFHPTPVVMLSSLTQEGADITFDALRYGAIDFIPKPSQLHHQSLDNQANEIVQKSLIASKIRTQLIQYIRLQPRSSPQQNSAYQQECKNIVVIGSAEGGYSSLLKIIPKLKIYPNTVYMAVVYDTSSHVDHFISYLRRYSEVTPTRVKNNMMLHSGMCYISLGEEYVTVHSLGGVLSTHVSQAPFTSRRGSVDMLMFSAAESVGRRALGVILTGAGNDGAEGLEEIIRVGGGAIVQAPVNCLYKDMPLAALNACEAEIVVSDVDIAYEIHHFLGYLVA